MFSRLSIDYSALRKDREIIVGNTRGVDGVNVNLQADGDPGIVDSPQTILLLQEDSASVLFWSRGKRLDLVNGVSVKFVCGYSHFAASMKTEQS